MDEEVLILRPGDEKSEKLARAMSSRTANSILQSIADSPKTASQISDEIGTPISTLSYHLDNLTDAGIIDVVEKKWSMKGRELKVYGLKQQVVIITPSEQPAADIRAMLLKYASLFVLVVFITLLLPVFAQYAVVPDGDMLPPSDTAMIAAQTFANDGMEKALAAPAVPPAIEPGARTYAGVAVSEIPLLNELVLGFFAGGMCVIIFLIVYDLLVMRRRVK